MPKIDAPGGGTPPTDGAKKTEQKEPPKLEVDVARDTFTRGTPSGLGPVFVLHDANQLADDVADLALHALRAANVTEPWHVTIVTDVAALGSLDTLALVEQELTARTNALAIVLADKEPPHEQFVLGITAGPATASFGALSTVLQGVGSITKLFAHDYHLSGQSVPAGDLGFDLHVAQKLLAKHPKKVVVAVERVRPTEIAYAEIVLRAGELERDVRSRLAPLVAAAAADAATAEADVTAHAERVASLQTLLVELLKQRAHAGAELDELRARLDDATATLAAARLRAAPLTSWAAELAALSADYRAFLDELTTPDTSGRIPLVAAARAAQLAGSHVLYVRLLAAGTDELVDLHAIRSDKWTTLAGAAAEFALVCDDVVLAAGVRPVLQATQLHLGNLTDSDKGVRTCRPLYVDVPSFRS